MMKNISNIQNKVCALNINMNGVVINHMPILFRIRENGTNDIEQIMLKHKDKILNIVYDHAHSIDDLMNILVNVIIYDITSDNDEYDTQEIKLQPEVSDDPRVIEIVTNKINEYSQLVLDKIKVNEECKSFVDAYDIVNKHNAKQISSDTFTQYIMSCFNEEYKNSKFINKLENCAYRIMTNKFNDLNNRNYGREATNENK